MENKYLYAIRYGYTLKVIDYTGQKYTFKDYNICKSGFIDFHQYDIKSFKRLKNACNYLYKYAFDHCIENHADYYFYMDKDKLKEKLLTSDFNTILHNVIDSNFDLKYKGR